MYPFRLGTTSYIIPDDILPNARYLAGRVQDIELVLFEVDDGPSNLPSEAVIRELSVIASNNDLTFTVHLPLDLRLGDNGDERHASLVKARKVIECALPLNPMAFVLHLDGREVFGVDDPHAYARWADRCVRALELAGQWAGKTELLAVENLDRYPPEHISPIVQRIGVSRCVDVGHLWYDGHDPLDYLPAWLDRTRVIHMHGIDERDHRSIAHVPEQQLDAVLRLLVQRQYAGVLTMEVFGEQDFETSLAAVQRAYERL